MSKSSSLRGHIEREREREKREKEYDMHRDN